MANEEQALDEESTYDEIDQEASSRVGKKKLILFVVLPLLLFGGGGMGVFFSGILDEPKEITESEKQAPPGRMVFYELPQLLSNLNGSERNPSVLKARVILQLIEGADIARLDQLKPRIIDILQVYMRELRIDDLRGSEGLATLRQELLARINEAVEPVKVSSVLFHEILIQ